MSKKPERPFNSRHYQGQLDRELIIAGIIILVGLGGGLIALIWGAQTFVSSLLCFGGGIGLMAIIWGFLKILEIVSRD